MILEKLVAAGIGSRPVVFVTHRCVGLVSEKSLMWSTVALSGISFLAVGC